YITPEGSLSGWVQFGHHRGPLNQVLLPGTGLHRHQPGVSSPFPTDPNDRLRWSRLIGALGESAWKRLRQQQYALIGLGRIGSMLTNDLAHLGVSSVIGVDPDLVEIWNLDAMDGVLLTDIAQPKVEAIARWFRQVWPPGRFSSIPYPIESTFALNRCKQADIIFSCADNEHARFTAAMLATFYHRPLIEIGTGVLDIHGQRRCGLEIRTILPDGNGCPVCLCGPFERNLLRRSPEEFGQGERLSSLRSLNHAAVGHAMMQLELLAQGSLSVSTHLRIDFDHQGNIQRNFSRHLQQNPQCTFCTYKGAGDIGLRCMDDLERLYIHGAM
ncbi:MAG TPA: ThiF family adenylyltransferase, partial [Gammaproteobacteria bacterium]|nr:ThiF family adenylyltransferase [Gammaproteobacteria bacterium]